MLDSRRGLEAVDLGERTNRIQGAPPFGNGCRDLDESVCVFTFQLLEPAVEGVCLLLVAASSDAIDALAELADDEDADVEIGRLGRAEPCGDARVGGLSSELGDDIRVEEKAHSSMTRAG